MSLIAFLCGVLVGLLVAAVRFHDYKRKFRRAVAYVDAMRNSLELMTNKVERIQNGTNSNDDEEIDAGIMSGISFVLKNKLSKV